MKELQRLNEAPGDGPDNITGGPVTEGDMSVWAVKCNNLDHADCSPACKTVAEELKSKGHDPAIEFRLHFPEDYPADPPFVYVHKPLITGGHIHGQGAMCLDVLHQSGWSPATKVDSLLRTIRSDIDNMFLLPCWADADGTMRCNSATQAHAKAKWISNVHSGWSTRQAEPHAPAAVLGRPAKRQRNV